jgi:predicted nuclease with TOPRIM domain
MNLFDRILGLKSEHQEQIDAMVAIVEENERLKSDNDKLEERISSLEKDMQVLTEELAAERKKVKNIEELIEASMAAIKDMK